jgi:hypothetical protein
MNVVIVAAYVVFVVVAVAVAWAVVWLMKVLRLSMDEVAVFVIISLGGSLVAVIISIPTIGTALWAIGAILVVVVIAYGSALFLGFRDFRASLRAGSPVRTTRGIGMLVLWVYLLLVCGGAALARSVHASWSTGVKQVVWEFADAVPVLKLTDAWHRPVTPGKQGLAEVILICIRAVGLIVVAPVLISFVQFLLRRDPEQQRSGIAERPQA